MQWREFLERSVQARNEQDVRISVIDANGQYMSYPVNGIAFTTDEVLITADGRTE